MERVLRRSAELAFIQLDTPVSLSCFMLLRAGEYDQLARKSVDSSNYLDTVTGAKAYNDDVQAADLLRKAPLATTFDRRKAAEQKFEESEDQCYRTNRLIPIIRDFPLGDFEYAVGKVAHRAKNWLCRVFGALPNDLPCGHGSGTTFELEGSTFCTLGDKITAAQAVTSDCEALFDFAWTGTTPAKINIRDRRPLTTRVRGNRFVTVPKDGKTDRGICVEPGGNLYLQKGIGSYLKERLGSIGIYVWRNTASNDPIKWLPSRKTAEDIHRRLAREGSVNGRWATIDLSNASDTLSIETVRWLLPDSWFSLMTATRSPFTRFKKKWRRIEKFSSMGNGYTFELETAIFCSLVVGVTGLTAGRDFFVYGDDIVLPTEYAEDVLAVLKTFGFTPNPEKSFTAGPFRESCGGDYFLGYNVRPFQIKTLDTDVEALRALHNGYVRRGLLLAAKHVANSVPLAFRAYGPPVFGDAVLWGGASSWKITRRNQISWITSRVFKRPLVPIDRWGDDFVISLMLLGAESQGLQPRGGHPSGTKLVWFSVS